MDKKGENATIEAAAADLICRGCPNCAACWEHAYEQTSNVFQRLESKLNGRSFITAADVLDCKADCMLSADLAEIFNQLHSGQMYDRANRQRAKELREILTGQLSSMEDILQDLSLRVSQVSYVDQALSGRVRDLLSRWGCPVARACVYVDEYGAKRTEFFVPHDFDADIVKITMEISEIAGCDFEYPTITTADRLDRYLFMEMPLLRLESAEFQTAGSRTDYSGDTLEVLALGNSEEYFIIADGMGTGRRAKLDSMFAASLANKMLTSGFSAQTAVRLINRILRVKGWDESFSTLDIAKFDLCRGTLDLLKAGAAASYLLRDEMLTKLEAQSFPLGILPETSAGSQHIRIFPGDRILLVSDGVDEITVKKHAVPCFGKKNKDMRAAVNDFGEAALTRQNRDKKDDITIIAIEVSSTRT